MNETEKKQFEQMKKDIDLLKPLLKYKDDIPLLVAFMQAKKKQQISLPLDESSKAIIRAT